MTEYLVLMLDETRFLFSRLIFAKSHEEALDEARVQYPESSIIRVESPEDVREREADMYHRVMRETDDDYDDYDDYDDDDE